MTFINVPRHITSRDIKRCGKIFKESTYNFILSDLDNKDIKQTLKLNGQGFYNYVYNVCGTYLFLIGNQKDNKDIKPQNIDFMSKVLKFEFTKENKPKQIKEFSMPSKGFYLITQERWLQDDFLGVSGKMIDDVLQTRKTYLQAYKQPYDRYLRYLSDSGDIGTFKHGLCFNTLTSDKLLIYKDTSIDGYIIKYNQDLFK